MSGEHEAVYLRCKTCMEHPEREEYPLEVLVEKGKLIIKCPEHGHVFSQPYSGPELKCAHCMSGNHTHH